MHAVWFHAAWFTRPTQGAPMNIRTSPLVQEAAEAKRPSRWWLGWPIAILLVVIPGAAVLGIANALLGNPAAGSVTSQWIELFTNGTTLILLALWVILKEGRPFVSVGLRARNWFGRFVLGVVIGAAMMATGVFILVAAGQYADGVSAHTTLGSAAVGTVALLVVVWIVQGSTEEIVVRGYMLQIGGLSLPAWVAIIGSSLIFAVAHLDFTPLPLINITLFAVFACFVALGQGSLWLIAGIHVGWNYFQGNVFGVPVSGHPRDVSIWAYGPTEGSSSVVNGGDFGIEGSLMGTALLAVATVIAFVYFRRSEARRQVAPAGVSAQR